MLQQYGITACCFRPTAHCADDPCRVVLQHRKKNVPGTTSNTAVDQLAKLKEMQAKLKAIAKD